jgi:hypothetical protein
MLNNLRGKINASYFIKQKLNQKYFCIVVSRKDTKER